jgi:magnesium transporter
MSVTRQFRSPRRQSIGDLQASPLTKPRESLRVSAACFTSNQLVRYEIRTPEELRSLREQSNPIWLQIQGLLEQAKIKALLGELEISGDLISTLLEQKAPCRIESEGHWVLMQLHRLRFGSNPTDLLSEQVNLLLTADLLVSIEADVKADMFPDLNRWLDQLSPPPRAEDLDDILHFLVDELLDETYPLLETLNENLNLIEQQTVGNVQPILLRRVYDLRITLRTIKQKIWPLRHQVALLLRRTQRLISDDALEGFRDMSQHVEQLVDQTEMLRHQCDAITQTFMAISANRMNQVMKTLAILSSIFTPIGFIAAVYGMNFQVIPATNLAGSFWFCLLLMAAIAVAQSYYLFQRGWFEDWSTSGSRGKRKHRPTSQE